MPSFDTWLEALEQRHLADLTPSEVARALRALSSCYVERRSKLAAGGALDSAGKRAAFALFYAPLHFLVTQEVVSALDVPPRDEVIDIGCGTGAAGAAWALHDRPARVTGFDRHPWAVAEANWTYRELGLSGRAVQGDASRIKLKARQGSAILLAYTVNELSEEGRRTLLPQLLDAAGRGSQILVVEPIARRMSAWWDDWAKAFAGVGGRDDEWRFKRELPPRQRLLAKAAGLNPRELTARTLFVARSGRQAP